MKRSLLSVLSILICLSSKSQFPSLSQHVTSGINTVEFWYENCFLNSSCYEKKDKVKAEVPPWIIGGGWRSYFMVDGTYTYVWSTPKSLIDNSTIDFKNDAVGPETVSLPYSKSSYFSTTSNIENWKRNYHSVYSAHYIPNTSQGAVSIGIMHGENKN